MSYGNYKQGYQDRQVVDQPQINQLQNEIYCLRKQVDAKDKRIEYLRFKLFKIHNEAKE